MLSALVHLRTACPSEPSPSLFEPAAEAERVFLERRRDRAADLEGAARCYLDLLRGLEALEIDRPCVSVFGSARVPSGDPAWAQARALGSALAEAGYAVMTGGGPGLMEAANRGAREAGGLSLGCNVTLPVTRTPNPYVDRFVQLDSVLVRKLMLVKHSCAFVVMPGGFGTLDAVFEVATLVRTGRLRDFPVIGLGGCWEALRRFLREAMVGAGALDEADLDVVEPAATVEEAVRLVETARFTAGAITRS